MKASTNDRRMAYTDAMRQLYERYPDDDEAGAFYAVSVLSAARALGNQSFSLDVHAEFADLAFKLLNTPPLLTGHPRAPTPAAPVAPVANGCRLTSALLRNGSNHRPVRVGLMLVVEHQPHSVLTHLQCVSARSSHGLHPPKK